MHGLSDRWWEPAALLDAAKAIKRSMPVDEFFRRSDMKAVREAIVAAEFVALRPWNREWQLRPLPESNQFPDVEFRSADDVRQFEVVEADRPDRKRSEEYARAAERKAAGMPDELEHYDPDEEADLALRVIVARIREKAEKHYRPNPHLLVYVILSGGEPTQHYALQLGELFGARFKSIWLLWQRRAYRLWPIPAKIKAT